MAATTAAKKPATKKAAPATTAPVAGVATGRLVQIIGADPHAGQFSKACVDAVHRRAARDDRLMVLRQANAGVSAARPAPIRRSAMSAALDSPI